MPTATATFALNAYPDGLWGTLDKLPFFGTVTITSPSNAYTYVTGGLPIVFQDENIQVDTPLPFFGIIQTFTALLTYRFDPTAQAVRIFASGTELTNGASVTADTCNGFFIVNRDSSPTG